jgi:DNA-binding protein H-NS
MARAATSHTAHGTTPLDFSKYTFADLAEIRKELEREMDSRKAKEVADLRAQVSESAHALGVSVEELFGLSSRSKRQTRHLRGPQPPKYKGPNGELWSGKGPAPKWMKPLLAKGKTKADFLIK